MNAIFYVSATGCQWRALPERYPNWKTVHRLHLEWSRSGTWERIADRLRTLVREREGHDPDPSAGIVDARSVRGASTVTGATRGYDGGKRVSGRKTFGIVDTLGLLVAVLAVAANVSDNTRWDRGRRPGQREVGPVREAVVRRRVQDHLREALPRSTLRGRGRAPHPPPRVRRASAPLDRRANLVLVDKQPPPTNRL